MSFTIGLKTFFKIPLVRSPVTHRLFRCVSSVVRSQVLFCTLSLIPAAREPLLNDFRPWESVRCVWRRVPCPVTVRVHWDRAAVSRRAGQLSLFQDVVQVPYALPESSAWPPHQSMLGTVNILSGKCGFVICLLFSQFWFQIPEQV